MARRKVSDENIRKLTKVGQQSLAVTIPINIVRKLKLRERQKVTVMVSGDEIIIRDWQK